MKLTRERAGDDVILCRVDVSLHHKEEKPPVIRYGPVHLLKNILVTFKNRGEQSLTFLAFVLLG